MIKSVCFITANHLREDVLELYCLGVERLKDQSPLLISSVCVGDKTDVTYKYNCYHIPYKNEPVSQKFNIACQKAREWEVDAVIVMGSDDIMNIQLFNAITSRSEDFVAIRDIYLYSLEKGYINELRYIKTNMVGCARMLSRELLDRVNWTPWKRERDWGLDQVMLQTIKPHIKSEYIFTASDVGGMCVDIKNGDSMNKFSKWKGLPVADPQLMFGWLSQAEKDLINNIINNLNP